jgi:hypothetical protein
MPDELPYPDVPFLEAKAIMAAEEVVTSDCDEDRAALAAVLDRLSVAELSALRRAALHLGEAAGRAASSMADLAKAAENVRQTDGD